MAAMGAMGPGAAVLASGVAELAWAIVPFWLYCALALLGATLPATWVTGYALHERTRQPLRYRLNGLRVLALSVALFVGLCAWGVLQPDSLFQHCATLAAGACAVGLLASLALVLGAPPVPGSAGLVDFYLGRRENPQWGHGWIDAKMTLYLVGAVLLELNVLSCAAHHYLRFHGTPAWNAGVPVSAALLSFFVCEYLWFERVHLFTYDFVAERVGFKLTWGCLCFYPFFYAIGLFHTAPLPAAGTGAERTVCMVGGVAAFCAGWALSRGANLQKYAFKSHPELRRWCGLSMEALEDREAAEVREGGTAQVAPQEAAPPTAAADPPSGPQLRRGGGAALEQQAPAPAPAAARRRVLVGGLWGVARHVNYLGELLMAVGVTLALARPWAPLPWLYPLYYVLLLVPRQVEDDRRCAAKYGRLWQAYCRRVPYRIVPGVY